MRFKATLALSILLHASLAAIVAPAGIRHALGRHGRKFPRSRPGQTRIARASGLAGVLLPAWFAPGCCVEQLVPGPDPAIRQDLNGIRVHTHKIAKFERVGLFRRHE